MIKITDQAKQKLISILDDEKLFIIRFGLRGGGCSGFQYVFSLSENKEEGDFEYVLNDLYVMVVDSISHMYLENSEIDYKKDLMGETFIFNSPNSSKCGCGQSVSF